MDQCEFLLHGTKSYYSKMCTRRRDLQDIEGMP